MLKLITSIWHNLYASSRTQPHIPFKPKKVVPVDGLTRIGTVYGGWRFIDLVDLKNSTIVSLGAGEDISFDIGFAARYNASVVIVDPTPRAVEHVRKVFTLLGKHPSQTASNDGNQPPESYDLSQISDQQLFFEAKAVWIKKGKIRFFKPQNQTSVSHSIVNFKNNYLMSDKFPHIYVPAITLDALLESYNLNSVKLLKMDIEGAELKVIPWMMNKKIFPDQLLVEFDGLQNKDKKSVKMYQSLDALLHKNGYVCVAFDQPANLLYARENLLKLF